MNHTHYRIFQFRQYNPQGELNLAVTAAAHFTIGPAGLSLDTDQPDPLLADQYFGDNPHGHLRAQADFVPYKPAGDVTALAVSHAPSGRPERSWQAEIHIRSRVKRLALHGPRFWLPEGREDWRLGDAEPVPSIPVDYYRAFGGSVTGSDPVEVLPDNPLGPGMIRAGVTPRDRPLPAPQIESPDDPVLDWRKSHRPEGIAPIAPWWGQRSRHAGSYDDSWRKTHHPFLPQDFDYAFYNCAHPDLIQPVALIPGEPVRLVNLHTRLRDFTVALPRDLPGVIVRYPGEDRRLPMLMDGAHFDLLGEEPKLRVTWRTAIPLDRRPIAELHVGLIPAAAPAAEGA